MFAIKVIWPNGEEDYLTETDGTCHINRPARFTSRRRAQEQVDFMKIGMEGDVQSINIVPFPK